MVRQQYNILVFLLLLLINLHWLSSYCSARPHKLEEQKQQTVHTFFEGAYEGFLTVKAFLGHYEDETVKYNLEHNNNDAPFQVGAQKDKKDQTVMKVFGVGLGRTGTTSLVIALEILGYNAIHDDEHVEITDLEVAYEEEVVNSEEYYRILGLRGYNATFKGGVIWDNGAYIRAHPDVKVILTVRDTPDAYVDSWLWAAPFIEMLQTAPFCWMTTAQLLLPDFLEEYKEETTAGHPDQFLDRETLRNVYTNYLNTVVERVDREQLLIFNVKEGWEPLCRHLGHPIPAGIPFPHVHTRARLQGEMFVLYLVTWIWPLVLVLPLVLLVAIVKLSTSWWWSASSKHHDSKKIDVKRD
mmetsp:Transcript_51835/g.58756  ORF Transcript_51835/g.58756 Transcript_51835/m.58756 type:complete len:354 (-) Transcript_51835:173-1234(-)